MLTNIAFLALICSGSVFCAASLKRSFEEVLPVTAMGMVCIVFIFGIFGFLMGGVIACLLLAAVLYTLAIVWLIWKREFKVFFCNLITPGFAVFFVIFLGLSYYNFGKLASSWDEFSHWIDIVKVMATLDDFGTNGASHSAFQSYPPGMSIFQYIFQKLTVWINPANTFSEWRVYVAYQIFSIIPLFPLLRKCSFRRPLTLLIYSVAFFVTPLLFYSNLYHSVYIDPYLGLVSGAGFLLILMWDDKDWLYHILIWLYCAMLVLAKDAGMIFVVFLITAYGLDILFCKDARRSNIVIGKKSLLIVGAVLAVVIPKMLWNWEIKVSGAAVNFSAPVDINILIDVLLGKDTSYRATVVENYINAQFDTAITLGHSPITINCFSLTVLFLLSLYLLYRLFAKKEPKRKYTAIFVMIMVAMQLIAYILGLCLMYMFKFSQYEAINLASMSRYLNMVFLCAWLVIIGTCCHAVTQWVSNRTLQLCLISAMLLITPMKSIVNFINGSNIEYSSDLREPYEPLKELIQTHCDGDDAIFFISQDNNGFDYWIARFNARPNSFNPNFTWAVGESEYEGGMYTRSVTAEQWQQELLEEYDYVAIYRLNGYFYEHYSVLFEDPSQITVNALYEVDKESGLLKRCG